MRWHISACLMTGLLAPFFKIPWNASAIALSSPVVVYVFDKHRETTLVGTGELKLQEKYQLVWLATISMIAVIFPGVGAGTPYFVTFSSGSTQPAAIKKDFVVAATCRSSSTAPQIITVFPSDHSWGMNFLRSSPRAIYLLLILQKNIHTNVINHQNYLVAWLERSIVFHPAGSCSGQV